MGFSRKIKRLFWSSQKRRIVVSIVSVVLAVGLVGGCLYIYMADQPEYQNELENTVKEPKKHQESDLQGLITGLTDRYVVQNAQGIDYFHNIQCNGDIIKYVNVDASNVDLAALGTYEITYTVGADSEKLAEHLKEAKSNSDDVENININKKIMVISLEEAQSLADAGNVVYNNNNEIVAKTDGSTNEEVTEEIENPVSPVDLQDDEDEEETNRQNNNNQTNSNTQNQNNQNNNNQSNNDQSTTPIPPVHQHTWVVDVVPGHYEKEEYVVYICDNCKNPNGGHYDWCQDHSSTTPNYRERDVWVDETVTGYHCSGCGESTQVPY